MIGIDRDRVLRRAVVTLKGQRLTLELLPEGIRLRKRYARTAVFTLPYGVAYQVAVRIAVDARKANRKRSKRK